MAVGDAYVFPGFLTPVLTQLFFPKPPTTFLTCFCRSERRISQEKSVTYFLKAEYLERFLIYLFLISMSYRLNYDHLTTVGDFPIFRVSVDFEGICLTERQTASIMSWFRTDLCRPDLPLFTLWTILSALDIFTIL